MPGYNGAYIPMLTYQQAYQTILNLLQYSSGNADQFLLALKAAYLPNLSFSKISTVEFCQHRYFLQHVKHLQPEPLPDYFIKGKLIHRIIADSYNHIQQHKPFQIQAYMELIENEYNGGWRMHLFNAAQVHMQNLWQDAEVIGIEEPFVIMLNEDLPPVVGIIDLILKQEDQYFVIDHKTGRDFYPQDELQMAIYELYIQRQYGATECKFFYDHYRWVNNLARIRKPAFQRTPVVLADLHRETALRRLHNGYQLIQGIIENNHVVHNGKCYRCPYVNIC